jgi:predicted nucleic-acid-binding Zn-ribbon protein
MQLAVTCSFHPRFHMNTGKRDSSETIAPILTSAKRHAPEGLTSFTTLTWLIFKDRYHAVQETHSVSVMKSVHLFLFVLRKIHSSWMHFVCIKCSCRKASLKLLKVTTGLYSLQIDTHHHENLQRVYKNRNCSSLQVLNRVTQNSSFGVVHQIVWFATHEDRSTSTVSHVLTISERTRSPQNRVSRKKLQNIIVIKWVYIFSHEWDYTSWRK